MAVHSDHNCHIQRIHSEMIILIIHIDIDDANVFDKEMCDNK